MGAFLREIQALIAVTDIANLVFVGIRLIGIRIVRAVVGIVRNLVKIRVRLDRANLRGKNP